MAKRVELTGRRYGRLTVLHRGVKTTYGRNTWVCLCDCGKDTTVSSANLGRATVSCGCQRIETAATLNRVHGGKHEPEYQVWCGIRDRCYNPKEGCYERYGARGIVMCDRWRCGDGTMSGYALFLADMGKRPPGMTIERIDNGKGYSPDNCRWATPKEQARNTRRNLLVCLRGEVKPLAAWCDEMRMPYKRIHARLRSGWPPERALTQASAKLQSRP